MRRDDWVDEAREKGYLLIRGGPYQQRRETWYAHCRAARRPFIMVRRRHDFASVEIDLWCTNIDAPQDEMDSVRSLLDEYTEPPCRIGYGPTSISADHVPLDRAEELAKKLAAMADGWRQKPSSDAGQPRIVGWKHPRGPLLASGTVRRAAHRLTVSGVGSAQAFRSLG